VDDERTNLGTGANKDVIATDVWRRREMITRIVNVYEQKNTHSGERLAGKLNWQRVFLLGCTVLAGVCIAHTIRWDPRCQVLWNAVFWEDLIDEN